MLKDLFRGKEVKQEVHFEIFQDEDGKAKNYFHIKFKAQVQDRNLECDLSAWEDIDDNNRADCQPIIELLEKGLPDKTMPVYFYVKNKSIDDFNLDMDYLAAKTGDDRIYNLDYEINYRDC